MNAERLLSAVGTEAAEWVGEGVMVVGVILGQG